MLRLRTISRVDVQSALPTILDQVELAAEVYAQLDAGAVEMPPKTGVHPRPDTFIHAMPAYLRSSDVTAIKWVAGYPQNPSAGKSYINGVIILNDSSTGEPVAVLDGSEITAARTAAASGACVARLAQPGWNTAAILGCGEQGRYHAAVLEALNPSVQIRAFDPVPERAQTVHARATAFATPREAVEGAHVVITAGPIVEHATPSLTCDHLEDDVLLLPIDFDFSVTPEVVRSGRFAVDHVGQYGYYRELGYFADWPDASESTGEALAHGRRPGRCVVANLGVAALDAAFAAAVYSRLPTLP